MTVIIEKASSGSAPASGSGSAHSRVMRRSEFVMLPVDGRFDLVRLRAFAAEFDQISDEEGGERYAAATFVNWLTAEADCTRQNLTNAQSANAPRSTPGNVKAYNQRRRDAATIEAEGASRLRRE